MIRLGRRGRPRRSRVPTAGFASIRSSSRSWLPVFDRLPTSMGGCRLKRFIEKNCLSMRRSWLAERLQPTVGAVDLAHRQLPISTLAPTPPWPATACSPATQQWYALTFPLCHLSHRNRPLRRTNHPLSRPPVFFTVVGPRASRPASLQSRRYERARAR